MKSKTMVAFFASVAAFAAQAAVNVVDFGAKEDGVTDDTEAIEKAIDAVAERGGATNATDQACGMLCLTFDDRHFDAWMANRDLFKKYDAHATFFVKGPIDAKAIEVMKALRADGHTVGLHSLNHRDPAKALKAGMKAEEYLGKEVFPQFDPCKAAGLEITSFACPNNDRCEKSDAMFKPYFRRIRAGSGAGRPWKNIEVPFRDLGWFMIPEKEFRSQTVHHALGIGNLYGSRLDQILECIDDLAEKNLCATFFSHNIEPKEMSFVSLSRPMLDAILKRAKEKGVKVVSFDELD